MMNIAALLSGGVDSSVVVHLLCEQGYRPTLFYIKIGMDGAEYMDCSAEEDIEMSALPLPVSMACRWKWWICIRSTGRTWPPTRLIKSEKGLTPNPDVMCNKLIKFGCFEQQCRKGFRFYGDRALRHYRPAGRQDVAGDSQRPC